ncbi:MAG: alkaline phosphatase family protein [Myxococcota bacterium]
MATTLSDPAASPDPSPSQNHKKNQKQNGDPSPERSGPVRERAGEARGPVLGPERPAGQGLGPHQAESGNRSILALLGDPSVGEQVDLVITYRQAGDEASGELQEPGAYEVWSARGLVRFQRVATEEGGVDYRVLEVVGENPLARQDPLALATLALEQEAARATGHDPDDPARRFIGCEAQSYPFAFERIAQLFDSPNAPDLAISPQDWAFGSEPGQHGALNVRQSRAPLWFCGAGIRPGPYPLAARSVDIAPTALAALGFPAIDGRDASGRLASERGVEPDVRLARQDGRVLEEILSKGGKPPKRLYIFLMDGQHQSELEARLADEPESLPNLRRLRARAAVLEGGSIVNFPSITWPSHTAIGTGAWCGHHDVVNPTYYLRDRRESVSPQGQQVHTEGFSSDGVESIYEAFHRVRGEGCLTAAIHAPFGRSARHAVLEGRNLGDKERLKALTREWGVDEDPRWGEEGVESVGKESHLDTRGLAQVADLFTRDDAPPPECVYHELIVTDGAGHHYGPHGEGLRAALDESDRRIGRVLDLLESLGLYDEFLFVVTADHGMSPQDTSLRANPARHVERSGMACTVAEPMIWLHDLAVDASRAPDGRTARVTVAENDPDAEGIRPPVLGARVRVERRHPGADHPERVAEGRTGEGGAFGCATPADVDASELWVHVEAEGFNPRWLRLDGVGTELDLRRALYGAS